MTRVRGFVAPSSRDAVQRFGQRFAVAVNETEYNSITPVDTNPTSEVVDALALLVDRVLTMTGSGELYATRDHIDLSKASNPAVTDRLRSLPEVNGVPLLLMTDPVGWRVVWSDGHVAKMSGFVGVEASDALIGFSSDFGASKSAMALTGSNITTANAAATDIDAVRNLLGQLLALPGSGELRVVRWEIRIVSSTNPAVQELARQMGSIGSVRLVV